MSTHVEWPLGQVATTEYDIQGRVSAEIDFNGAKTVFDYQPFSGLLESSRVFVPDGGGWAEVAAEAIVYGYWPDGSLRFETTEQGTTQFLYDGTGRLQQRVNPDGAAIRYESA